MGGNETLVCGKASVGEDSLLPPLKDAISKQGSLCSSPFIALLRLAALKDFVYVHVHVVELKGYPSDH